MGLREKLRCLPPVVVAGAIGSLDMKACCLPLGRGGEGVLPVSKEGRGLGFFSGGVDNHIFIGNKVGLP